MEGSLNRCWYSIGLPYSSGPLLLWAVVYLNDDLLQWVRVHSFAVTKNLYARRDCHNMDICPDHKTIEP